MSPFYPTHTYTPPLPTLIWKLWCTFHEESRVEYACRKSLENLGLDYIDLYIMHFPVGLVYHSDEEPWPKNPDGTQETKYVLS